jgi:hypothetical protein
MFITAFSGLDMASKYFLSDYMWVAVFFGTFSTTVGGMPSRRLGVRCRYMAAGQLVGLPSEITALQMELPIGLARIAASSPQHVWSVRWYRSSIEKQGLPSDTVPVARTTAKSRQQSL